MVCSGFFKNDSLCYCSQRLSKCCVASRCNPKSWFDVNAVLALQLWKNFLIRNSTNMKMMRNLITVSGTLRIEEYCQPLLSLTKDTKRLCLIITSSWYRTKSKATTGLKDNASYIRWLYTTWDEMVASNKIHCDFSSDDNNHYRSFVYQVQTMHVYYLEANHPHVVKN